MTPISQHFNKFKLDIMLIRVSSYCAVHDIEHYVTKIGGYKFEITKYKNTTPALCTFEDLLWLPDREIHNIKEIISACK